MNLAQLSGVVDGQLASRQDSKSDSAKAENKVRGLRRLLIVTQERRGFYRAFGGANRIAK
jgi:hypothetical protein